MARLDRSQRRHLEAYGHVGSDTHPVEPYAYFLYLYQEPVYFPGIVFGLVLAAGLAGAVRQWRRGGGPPALPWAVAALGIVVPVAVHEYHYRYAITVIPVACLAAGLAFARHPGPAPQAAPAPSLAGAERAAEAGQGHGAGARPAGSHTRAAGGRFARHPGPPARRRRRGRRRAPARRIRGAARVPGRRGDRTGAGAAGQGFVRS